MTSASARNSAHMRMPESSLPIQLRWREKYVDDFTEQVANRQNAFCWSYD
jgi:hypothetical protein